MPPDEGTGAYLIALDQWGDPGDRTGLDDQYKTVANSPTCSKPTRW